MAWEGQRIKYGAVICCGNISADIVVRPVSEPGWGKTTWVDDLALHLGGNGANAAYTLATMGIPVRLLGCVGMDPFADVVLGQLRGAGVDTSQVERTQADATASTAVLVHPDGSRALLHRPGAGRRALAYGIAASQLTGFTRLHLANIFNIPAFHPHAASALRRARESGMATSMDTGWDAQGLWMKTIGPCLPYTDLLFVNEDEARELSGTSDPHAASEALRLAGAKTVVVKLGGLGCLVNSGDAVFRSPAFEVTPVDTTGAGDCFSAAFVAALQRGFDVRQAVHFANGTGARSVSYVGATTGVLPWQTLFAWMEQASRLE